MSAEKVVATMEIPKSHQGIFLPERKNSVELLPAVLDAQIPIRVEIIKKATIIDQSSVDS